MSLDKNRPLWVQRLVKRYYEYIAKRICSNPQECNFNDKCWISIGKLLCHQSIKVKELPLDLVLNGEIEKIRIYDHVDDEIIEIDYINHTFNRDFMCAIPCPPDNWERCVKLYFLEDLEREVSLYWEKESDK